MAEVIPEPESDWRLLGPTLESALLVLLGAFGLASVTAGVITWFLA